MVTDYRPTEHRCPDCNSVLYRLGEITICRGCGWRSDRHGVTLEVIGEDRLDGIIRHLTTGIVGAKSWKDGEDNRGIVDALADALGIALCRMDMALYLARELKDERDA
jgi:hypothetical protein